MSRRALAFVPILLFASTGCGKTGLAAPFDKMKDQPITVLRLHNVEAPPQAGPAPAPTQQLPPQIQAWLAAGASMLPPGLIPPGLLNPNQPPPPPNAQTFHGFRVAGWMAVTDPKQREEVLDIFGHASSFTDSRGNCMYPEFGISIGQPNGQPPAEMLVTLACDRVQAFNFQWPYSKNGLAAETVKRIVGVMSRSFGG
jgi:hypothetical protein